MNMELTSEKSMSSTQKTKGRNLPKSESRLSTEKKRKMKKSGLNLPLCATGFTNQNQQTGKRPIKETTFRISVFVILVSIISNFASIQKQIVIGSHNLHGFKKSVDYHRSCIRNHGGVWFAQELWLQEKQLSQLQQLDSQFTAHSGMESAVSAGMLRGRPFGGVSIAWSRDLNHVMNPVSNFRHKRVVAAELKSGDKNFLLISVYMPFFDASNKEECMAETQDALSMIEVLIENHP